MIPFKDYDKYKCKITSNTIMCLDIEVSSYWLDGSKIISYDSTLSDDYYNSIDKCSCVYIWMFSINDIIFYGREWNDFKKFLQQIKKDVELNTKERAYIYIHNLAYEFQFLRNLFNDELTDVFAREVRKPMKASVDCFEFRCSYTLTNLSLASWGKQLGLPKMVGDLDYTKLRSPLTKMTQEEYHYCERDIEVMILGLKKYIDKYESIKNIPMTSTGEVRRVVTNMYKRDNNYHRMITRLMPRTVEEYKVFKGCFGGGDTHTNVVHSREVLYNVFSEDETSAYPGIMVRYMLPCTPFNKVSINRPLDFEKYSYIFCLVLRNVKLKGNLSYLAKSRCISASNCVLDNGRIISADEVGLYCTEYDYQHITRLYTFDETIVSIRRARKNYLDTRYVDYILQLFEYKTTLKGVEGYEDLYQESKARLNSLYGMMVTDILNPVIEFKEDWSAIPQLEQDVQKGIDTIHKKWYKNNLSYINGVYVTSIARHELWTMIESIGDDVCYFDTDSIKGLNFEKHKHKFEKRNKEIIKETKKAMSYHNFDSDRFMPIAPNGKKSILGTWDFEGIYDKAKFLGAKKYLTETAGEKHITVSGVPKRAVDCIKSFDDFEDGFVFDSEICRKGLSTYLDGNNPKCTLPDGYVINQPFGINIRNIGYTLGLTEEYKSIIRFMKAHGEI